MSMRVMSVNVGRLETIPGAKRRSLTGIFKRPVFDPVKVEREGLHGDHIGSVKYHGGPDQAVYLYSIQDYRWWEEQLGRELAPGTFGENLTVNEFGSRAPHVGDRWHIGELVLEISGPRIPCVTLAQRMEDPRFVKRFAQANRGGCYARVLNPGWVQAGMQVEIRPAPQDYPEVDQVFALCHSRDKDPVLLQQAIESPLAQRCKEDLEKWSMRLS